MALPEQRELHLISPGGEGQPTVYAVSMANGEPASGAGQEALAVRNQMDLASQTIIAGATDRRIAGIIAGLQSVQAEVVQQPIQPNGTNL